MTRRTNIALVVGGLLLAAFAVLATLLPGIAMGVRSQGPPTTTVTPATAGSTAEYLFSRYRTDNRENVTGCQVTFPAGTNVADATAVDPAGTVVVNTVTRTVTITFTDPIVPQRTTFTLTVGGIVNPSAGTYNVGNITFYTVDTLNGTTGSTALATGDYTITGSYLSMTITTPGTGQSVDFGNIDPGVTTAAQQVTVQIDSSAPYTVSRTQSGDDVALGLVITGTATGAKPAGLATFTDDYTLTPSWDATPSVPLTATVVYTAIQ